MDERSIHWTRLIRLDDDVRSARRAGLSLVVSPPEWARGLASLIKLSDEFRDVGLLVTNVGPSSQAASAGIERGDVLLRYDGVPLETIEQLRNLEGVAPQGETPRRVTVEGVRGAREVTFTVTAGRLGITVSALLHRLRPRRRAVGRVILAPEHGARVAAGMPTLVEVPRELVSQVALLAEVLQRPRSAKQRKKVEALIETAAAMA